MKVLQSDTEKCAGVDEKPIKFQSSQNLHKMKKHVMKRVTNVDSCCQLSPQSEAYESPQSTDSSDKTTSNPPLPTLLPPSEGSPLTNNLSLSPKQEKKETEEKSTSPSLEETELKIIKKEKLDEHEEDMPAPPPKPPVCRDFIRGTCTRSGTCKFLHEYDPSQLYGVYTFCRNFQNSICTFAKCRYVHATIFEEQRFYRTGILPPSAISHQKNNSTTTSNKFVLQPPPPPPPRPAHEDVSRGRITINLSKPPPPLPNRLETAKSLASVNCISTGGRDTIGVLSPSLKRNIQFNASPRGQEANAKRSNKCENCVLLENRLEYTKTQVDNMIKASFEIDEKMNCLEKKNTRLLTCLLTLIQSLGVHAQTKSMMPPKNSNAGSALGTNMYTMPFGDNFVSLQQNQNKDLHIAEQLMDLIKVSLTKINCDENGVKAFQIPQTNNVQPEHPSVNLTNLNPSRLTDLLNTWGNHRP